MPKYHFCITRLLGLIAAVILLTGMFPLFGVELSTLINIPAAVIVFLWPLLLLLAFGTSKAPKFLLACIYSLCSTPAEPDADIEALASAGKWISFAAGIIYALCSTMSILRDLRDLPVIGHGIAMTLIGLIYSTFFMLFLHLVQFSHASRVAS